MSNHDGSYMLNKVLLLLEKRGFFLGMKPAETKDFIKSILKIGNKHDCNDGEILEDIGESLGICYYCLEFSKDLDDGLCSSCR
ncbi:MAG TPA: hypothetical protein PL110_20650 [Candidatus Eremiobacteraeota bacterium]|nr:MAG: hypothetical protein BWY64_03240 [bacterium ADurb.Bin363]HPZ10511.1 hypothetical protein [Candidatus Eremiobacteraeota bacterium]